ncbi:MAG: hypothetical protein AAGF94_14340 [Pseudomonadota bacterium]
MSIFYKLLIVLGLVTLIAGCAQEEPEEIIIVEPEPEFTGKL